MVNILTLLFSISSCEHLIKDMEAPLIIGLSDHSGLFQKVRFNVSTSDVAACIEVDSDEFTLQI